MQFSAVVNRFIVEAYLNSIFTNDLKRKENFSENVHNCGLGHFKQLSVLKTFFLGLLLSGRLRQVLL